MMRAAVWEKPGELKVTEAADPVPRHGELVVQVGACGICGTDLHIADGEFPPTPYPIIPGHEFVGRVVDIGGGAPGAFAEYVAVPAANAYRIPDNVDDQQGALIEPLSCAVHGLRRIGPVLGEDVLLIGAGTMGLLLLQLLNRAGARSVTVVDRKAARLEVAKAVGAASAAEDVPEADRGTFGVAVDATGVPAAIEAAFGSLARGGRLMIFGVASADAAVSLSPFRIYNDEITVLGSMAVLNSFGAAADLMAAGAVDTAPMLGPPFALDQFPEALASVRNGEGVKIQVAPGS
jgi:NADPH2:quinone reductase